MRGLAAIAVLLAAPLAAADTTLYLAAAQLCLAQQESPDPFLEQVNAELDRREGTAEGADEVSAPAASNTRGGLYYLRVISALSLVVGLILVAGYAARRAGGRTPLLAGADLGRVLGRIYLSRTATIYFIETSGKVLLIGVTGQSITTLGQFDSEDYSGEPEEAPAAFNPESFLAQLESSSRNMRSAPRESEDDDMQSLRRDIERLQDFLREESRETRD